MLRRGFVLTRSDYLWDPAGQQNHMFGLSHWVPISGIGAATNDGYSMRSGMGYHGVFAFDYFSVDHSYWMQSKKVLTEMASLRQLFLGDFTTLTPADNNDSQCSAWQFLRQDTGRGLVQAFRREGCRQAAMTVHLTGLLRSRMYQVTDLDEDLPQQMSGGELMDQGLTIRFPLTDGTAAKVITFTMQKH